MSRIPSHTIEDAPPAARPLLHDMLQFSPTGRPLNLHAQLAHAPAVLEAYVAMRKATAQPAATWAWPCSPRTSSTTRTPTWTSPLRPRPDLTPDRDC